jgi:adenylate cyclase
MATESFKRKLTAILSADVKGYSRLMGENEAETVKTLTSYRKIMAELVQQHRGRVIDSPGDNILAEFGSVVDAVQCSVAAQNEFKARNAELPENRRMVFRIGINLGDVIEEEGRIYGDGVNIAARLEALADPGGICISKTAFDHIESKLPLGYQFLGEQTVKNIAKPVGAYKVLMEPRVLPGEEIKKIRGVTFWKRKSVIAGAVALLVVLIGTTVWNFYGRAPKIEPASKEKMAFPLPDKPSIAVLPFANMSEDPKQEFLCDGMTEAIITALSKVPRMFVIARNSTFTYKGKPVKVKQVSEDLGVQYVLEGSLQRSGDRLRITAQLIDALTGNHLWAERYDRDLKDIFALQDEITINVLNGIRVKLAGGGEASMSQKYAEKYYRGKQGLDCYLKLMEAAGYLDRFNIEDTNLARGMIEAAVAMCPENPMGYLRLGWVYHRDFALGNTKSPRETLEKGKELAQKALAMDDSHPGAHTLLCALYRRGGEYDKSLAEGERAVALDPNSTGAIDNYASSLIIAGRPEEAIPLFQKAIRLNPFAPSAFYRDFGAALRDTGRFEEAVSAYKKAIQIAPDHILAHVGLASTYIMMGREKEARAEAAEVLRINPKFSVDSWAKTFAYKDRSQQDKIVNAVRNAGLPDKPPLPLPDKPSIAVLPFVNMSDDKSQEYFSDGLTEDIIAALSKTPKLFVIARNSSFVYKGKPVNVQQVSRDLGVKYVLEGSVRRSGDQLRITAQLIDATTGNHLWSERYDRELKNIFAIQDDVTLKVLTAIRVKLTEGELSLGYGKHYEGRHGLDCYLKIMEGNDLAFRKNTKDNNIARGIATDAIAMCPEVPMAYLLMASVYSNDYWFDSSADSVEKAIELTKKSLALDDTLAEAHSLLGYLYTQSREYEKGIAEGERAITLSPGVATVLGYYGFSLSVAGRAEEAIPLIEKAIRLNPFGSFPSCYNALGNALMFTGRYEEAVSAYKKYIEISPNFIWAHVTLAATYSMMGREKEAQAEAAEILSIDPKFSLDFWAKTALVRDQSIRDKILVALRKAGLK